LRRRIISLAQEIFRDIHGLHQFKEVVPGFWLSGKDYFSGRGAANINLTAFEAIFNRKTHRLAAAILKEFGNAWHISKYITDTSHDIYHDSFSSKNRLLYAVAETVLAAVEPAEDMSSANCEKSCCMEL
jgi:hypothetical protein